MEFRTLGNTDLEVSMLCLGTMTFGEQNSEAEAHEQLDIAVDCGINFIDTAEMYPVPPRETTQGLTEQYVGTWLRHRGRREDVVIASKVAGPGMMDYLRGGAQLTKKHIDIALQDSLRRLQTDYIDLYQVHWPSRSTNFFGKLGYQHQDDEQVPAIEETLSAMIDAQQAGKIRHIGISNETPWGLMQYLQLSERHAWPRVVSVQNPYNLLNRSYEIGLAEMSIREQVGLLAYSPLAFGVLSGKYLNGQRPAGGRITLYERFTRYSNSLAERAVQKYFKIANDNDLSLAQMALAYVNSREFLTSNIIGATTVAQLRENIQSADLKLTSEVLNAIENVHTQIPNPCP